MLLYSCRKDKNKKKRKVLIMDKKYEDYSFENDLGYDEYLWYRDHPEEAKKEKEYEFDQWKKQAIMDDKAE